MTSFRKLRHLLLAFTGTLYMLTIPARAAKIVVTSSADSGPRTLRRAIANAASGDEIRFAVRGSISLQSEITVAKNLTIVGPGAPDLGIYVDYNNFSSHRFFRITNGAQVSISGLTLVGGGVSGSNGRDAAGAASGESGENGGNGLTVNGGAIANAGVLTIDACEFWGNSAFGGPGGIGGLAGEGGEHNGHGGQGGAATGGAIYNTGDLTVNASTFIENRATGGYGGQGGESFPGEAVGGNGGDGGVARGGAILNVGRALVVNSTFWKNEASGGGGGAAGVGGTDAELLPGTPGSAINGSGGAIANMGHLTLRAVTITENRAQAVYNGEALPGTGVGGGFSTETNRYGATPIPADTEVFNSIIAGNSAGGVENSFFNSYQDVFGYCNSLGYNIFGVLSYYAQFPTESDRFGWPGSPLEPRLGPPLYNGGLTRTLLPYSDSPAIDAGSSNGSLLTADQRGVPRPYDTRNVDNVQDGTDIGAVERTAESTHTFVVNTNADHEDGACTTQDCSLRDALRASMRQAGAEVITFAPSVTGAIALTMGQLWVRSDVEIRGPGAAILKIDGQIASRLFYMAGQNITLSGLTLARGNGADSAAWLGTEGGAIISGGEENSLTVRDCVFSNNKAQFGGALANFGAHLEISNTAFRRNRVSGSGSFNGGQGGAIGVNWGTLNLNACDFTDNFAGDAGGALHNWGTLRIRDCDFKRNIARHGGALSNGESLMCDNTRFTENQAMEQGGAIEDHGSHYAPASLSKCVFTANTANDPASVKKTPAQGGAIYLGETSSYAFADTLFIGNSAQHGGGFFNAGALSLRRCTLQSQTVGSGEGDGGGGYNDGHLTATACHFLGNSAGRGGALFNHSRASLTLLNSTLAANHGVTSGGALHNEGSVQLVHCTVTANEGGTGAGIANLKNATVGNTIIAGNTSPNRFDVTGVFTSSGFNLVGVASRTQGFSQTTDQRGTLSAPLNAKLTPFDAGGVTLYKPLSDSPVVDKGSAADLGRDAVGHIRPINFPTVPDASGGDGSDIGAIELPGGVSPAPTPTPTTTPPPPPLANR